MKKNFLLIIVMALTQPCLAAIYQVPGFENQIGNYEMDFDISWDESEVAVYYDLPLDLTGVSNRIEFSGVPAAGGIAILKNENAELVCQKATLVCNAKYKNIKVDLDTVRLRLQKKGLDQEQIESRLAVSRAFSGDPIGVIVYDQDDYEQHMHYHSF